VRKSKRLYETTYVQSYGLQFRIRSLLAKPYKLHRARQCRFCSLHERKILGFIELPENPGNRAALREYERTKLWKLLLKIRAPMISSLARETIRILQFDSLDRILFHEKSLLQEVAEGNNRKLPVELELAHPKGHQRHLAVYLSTGSKESEDVAHLVQNPDHIIAPATMMILTRLEFGSVASNGELEDAVPNLGRQLEKR